MASLLPPLRLTGATCLREGQLQQRSIALAEGRFTTGPYPAVDLRGYYILPGIVDLYATPPDLGSRGTLARLDRAAASYGITTQRIAVPWSWDSAPRKPEAARRLAEAHGAARADLLTDIQLQLACEALLAPEQAALLSLVRTCRIPQVIFTNHAAWVDNMRGNDPAGFLRWALVRGLTADRLSAALDAAQRNAPAMPRHLCQLAECFDELGVLYGSDGDLTAEQREHHSMIGARLCINPGTARVAAAARAVGDPILTAADPLQPADPTAPRMASQAAPRPLALIHAGLCDALVSGCNPAALVPLVFRLADGGAMPLERAWRLVSDLPARIARMPDRGVIAPGKRADLTIVNATTRAVEATIAAGRLSYLGGDAAARFLRLTGIDRLAAE